MKRIPTEADLERIEAALTAVEGVTGVSVSVVLHVQTDVRDQETRQRIHEAEAEIMGAIDLPDAVFDFGTTVVPA